MLCTCPRCLTTVAGCGDNAGSETKPVVSTLPSDQLRSACKPTLPALPQNRVPRFPFLLSQLLSSRVPGPEGRPLFLGGHSSCESLGGTAIGLREEQAAWPLRD